MIEKIKTRLELLGLYVEMKRASHMVFFHKKRGRHRISEAWMERASYLAVLRRQLREKLR